MPTTLRQPCSSTASPSSPGRRSGRPPRCGSEPARRRSCSASTRHSSASGFEHGVNPVSAEGLAGASAILAPGREAPVFAMKTTLKRGVGRATRATATARCSSRRGRSRPSRSTASRSRRSGATQLARARDSRLGARRASSSAPPGVAGGAYLYAARVGRRCRAAQRRREGDGEEARPPVAGAARNGPRDRLRPPCERGEGRAVALRHAHAHPRQPEDRDDLAALLPARPAAPRSSARARPRTSTKINAAYADCGSRGTLDTVRKLTGVPVNYLITVNFRGFTQVVDKLGGIWMDVDRRYYNNNSGPSGYATINLQPGYQKLNGYQALDVRPLPAHGQRPLPQRSPAELRPGIEGSGAHQLLADASCRR